MHAHVHHDDLRLRSFSLGNGFLAGRCIANHLDIGCSLEDQPHAIAKKAMIVGQNDANRSTHAGAFKKTLSGSSARGKRASTRVPPPTQR